MIIKPENARALQRALNDFKLADAQLSQVGMPDEELVARAERYLVAREALQDKIAVCEGDMEREDS
jgi:hypothetical protein